MAVGIDTQALVPELMRALRGKQSQRALSMRLGFASNLAYRWERGQQPVFAHDLFRLLRLQGIDVHAAIRSVWGPAAAAVADLPADAPEIAERFLASLLVPTTLASAAERLGMSRHVLGRMARGEVRVRLDVLLAVLEDTTNRALDFVACFTDPSQLPSVASPWAARQVLRQLYVSRPWVNVLLVLISTPAYRGTPRHDDGWLASRLGPSREAVADVVAQLAAIDVVRWNGTHWEAGEQLAVDMGRTPAEYRATTAYWTEQALHRIPSGQALTAVSIYGVDEAHLRRMSEALLAGFQQARAIGLEAQQPERVGLVMVHVVGLDGEPLRIGRQHEP